MILAPVAAQQPPSVVKEENNEFVIYRGESAQNAFAQGLVKSLNANTKLPLTIWNYSSKKIQIDWVNYEGVFTNYSHVDPWKRWDISTFATHPWALRHSEQIMMIVTMKSNTNRTFYLADCLNGAIDISTNMYYVQPGLNYLDNNQSPSLRSIHSNEKISVRFTNQSAKTVKLNWINFKGQQQKYVDLPPGNIWDVDTFATHPWAFVVDGVVQKVLTILTNKCDKKEYIIKDAVNQSICIV